MPVQIAEELYRWRTLPGTRLFDSLAAVAYILQQLWPHFWRMCMAAKQQKLTVIRLIALRSGVEAFFPTKVEIGHSGSSRSKLSHNCGAGLGVGYGIKNAPDLAASSGMPACRLEIGSGKGTSDPPSETGGICTAFSLSGAVDVVNTGTDGPATKTTWVDMLPDAMAARMQHPASASVGRGKPSAPQARRRTVRVRSAIRRDVRPVRPGEIFDSLTAVLTYDPRRHVLIWGRGQRQDF